LLASRLTPNLEDHSLLAIRDYLFYIFAATLYTLRPSPPSANRGRVIPSSTMSHKKRRTYICLYIRPCTDCYSKSF